MTGGVSMIIMKVNFYKPNDWGCLYDPDGGKGTIITNFHKPIGGKTISVGRGS